MHSSRMRTVRSSSHVYPSMHWAGGCVSQNARGRGMSADGGVCPGEMSAQGVSAQGDVCPGGVCQGDVRRGGCLPVGCNPACTEADTPPPVNRMTDRCKNITLPQLMLQTVMTLI